MMFRLRRGFFFCVNLLSLGLREREQQGSVIVREGGGGGGGEEEGGGKDPKGANSHLTGLTTFWISSELISLDKSV